MNIVDNYRPISLTSVISKIIESLVRDNIVIHVMENRLFAEEQHGFVQMRNCVTHLLESLETWSQIIEDGCIDIIYTDFSQAFDSVPHIRLLIYADDLVIMSTSAEGLQECLNKLATYCNKWRLQVNLKKTKIILFNRQGSLIKKHSFLFMSNNIEVTKQYKYLGFIFTCSGSTIVGVRNLINQAQKEWFSIKYYLSSSKNKNIDTYLTLFETQIKPILLYAREAWADSMKANIDDVTLLTGNKLEIFQISIFKQILGVSRKTTNLAILLDIQLQLTCIIRQLKTFQDYIL